MTVMVEPTHLPKLYRELADWWPVLSAPEEYAEEAEFYRQTILSHCGYPPKTMLELGCGGGNNASHLKAHFELTLVDLSPGMLAVSRKLNPECEHLQGDMRDIRLGRQFDVVFIHDAIAYMTTESDLRRAIETAYCHCKPGGVALFAPDQVRETFKTSTDHGGHDGEGCSLRYLEWAWDPDPEDTRYLVYMVYLLRRGDNAVRCVEDRHELGLFSHDDWMRLIREAGFQPKSLPFGHSLLEPGSTFVFLGLNW
ncbi:MAG: class I SAM-dependent methyltransferase [Chloroflexi bacterium]|nr:class I SAM-dependent methyltransferase [Chloroflexota bacterium]